MMKRAISFKVTSSKNSVRLQGNKNLESEPGIRLQALVNEISLLNSIYARESTIESLTARWGILRNLSWVGQWLLNFVQMSQTQVEIMGKGPDDNEIAKFKFLLIIPFSKLDNDFALLSVFLMFFYPSRNCQPRICKGLQ